MAQTKIKIIFRTDYDEFEVIHPNNKNATYYTDCKVDAVDTAHAMARESGFSDYKIKHVRK